MDRMIVRGANILCSDDEARRWNNGCPPDIQAFGNTIVRFSDDSQPEVGVIGSKVDAEIENQDLD